MGINRVPGADFTCAPPASCCVRGESNWVRLNWTDCTFNAKSAHNTRVLPKVKLSILTLLVHHGGTYYPVTANYSHDLKIVAARRYRRYKYNRTARESRIVVPIKEVRIFEQAGDRKALTNGMG